MVWSYRKGNAGSLKKAQAIKSDFIQNKVYTGGLEVEEQKIESKNNAFSHNFAGTVIEVSKALENAPSVSPLNRNQSHIVNFGRQKIIRYTNNHTYTKNAYKKGMQIGTLFRLRSQSSTSKSLMLSVRYNLLEMYILGYTLEYTLTAMGKLAKRDSTWEIQIHGLLYWLHKCPAFVICRNANLAKRIRNQEWTQITERYIHAVVG